MYETRIRVRLSETDALGVVYYGQYFMYFDVARLEMLRHMGITAEHLKSRGLGFFAAEACCQYLASARFDEVLRLGTWIDRMGKTSLKYGHMIKRVGDRKTLVKGHVVDVLVDSRGRPVAFPGDLRAKLQSQVNPSRGGAHAR